MPENFGRGFYKNILMILINEKNAVSVIPIAIIAGKTKYAFSDQYLFKDKKVTGIFVSNEYVSDSDIEALQAKARLTLLDSSNITVVDKMKLADLRTYATYFQLSVGKILFEKSSIELESLPTPSEVGKTINLIVVYERA